MMNELMSTEQSWKIMTWENHSIWRKVCSIQHDTHVQGWTFVDV